MKNKIGYVGIFTLLFCVILGFRVDGAGGIVNKRINVSYHDIKLYVDGKQVEGEEPFVLTETGVTMIPARAAFEALGKTVFWDEKNQALYVESKPEENKLPAGKAASASGEEFSWLEDLTVIRNVGSFFRQSKEKFMIAAGAHPHGVGVDLKENGEAEVVIRTNGRYQSIEGWLGVDDTTMNSSGGFILTIYADGNKIYESRPVLPAQYPSYVSPEWTGISGALTVKFQVKWVDSGFVGDYKDLTAVLADFKLIKK